MYTNLILPPDEEENIVDYFKQYGLTPFLIPTPFLKFPSGISEKEFFSSRERVREYYATEANKPENNISWKTAIRELEFPSITYLNHVLFASSGFIGRRSTRFDYDILQQDALKLQQWLDANGYNIPTEGQFPPQYDLLYLKTLMKCGYSKAIFSDDLRLKSVELELGELVRQMEDEKLFLANQVKDVLGIRSMCSPDLKITFTIHSESFFTILAATEELLTKILKDFPYEGFWPEKDMTHFL